MEPQYVFIVGLPRTGTKLMVNILESFPDRTCNITLENFFLGRFLRPGVRQALAKIGDMSVDENVHKFVDDIYSGKFFGAYWRGLADGTLKVDKQVMLASMLNSDRSEKGIYLTLLRVHARITDGSILGDKSGPHLYHVPTLLEWFPEAKIIHTFRDPRAVLASEHKKLLRQLEDRSKKASKSGNKAQAIFLKTVKPVVSLIIVLYVTTAWLYAVRLHYKYKRLYPNNYYLSKFEDLVSEPEENVKNLCEFLNVQFHTALLNPPKIGSSYSREAGTGFDKRTLTRWQNYLKPWMNAWLLFWGRKYLKEFDYII